MNLGKSVNVALAMSGKNRKWLYEELNITKGGLSILVTRGHANSKRIEELANIFKLKASEFIALGEE